MTGDGRVQLAVTTYAVTNVTTGKTSGPFPSVEDARKAMPDLLSDGDEFHIVAMVNERVGAGSTVDEGRYNAPST